MRRKLPLWILVVVCFLFAVGLICFGIFYDDESLLRRSYMLASLLILFEVWALFFLIKWVRRGEVTLNVLKHTEEDVDEARRRDAEMNADPSGGMSLEQLDEAINKRRRN